MKRIVTLLSFAFLMFAGLGEINAQEQDARKQVAQESKDLAYKISDKIGIEDDKVIYVQRVIHSYKLGMLKIEHNEGLDSETYNKYKEDINEEFKANAKHLFKDDEAKFKEFLEVYEDLKK